MRTLLSHRPGGPETLLLEERPDIAPGPGEVLIDVHAAALNYPDVLLIQDLYQIRPPRPFAPGSEVAGVVRAVGSGVTRFRVGDRVIGTAAWGGLATQFIVPEANCIAIPAGMPVDLAPEFRHALGEARQQILARLAEPFGLGGGFLLESEAALVGRARQVRQVETDAPDSAALEPLSVGDTGRKLPVGRGEEREHVGDERALEIG